ncbi:TPA: hypothetical protein ACH3X1_009813 [Trebouxia sp. C0004]
MRALKQLARAGHTIVASIHQPPTSVWIMMDQVVLLAGGRTLYAGASGQIQHWFIDILEYPYFPSKHGTVGEWLLQLVTTAFAAQEDDQVTMESNADIIAAADAWQVQQVSRTQLYMTHQDAH